MQGQLILVGTPIGNLEDMTPRAVRALNAVDLILAEDTRHSAKLLQHFAIGTPMRSWHAHNENDAGGLDKVLQMLSDGQSIALISDAGMPLISDPGYTLVQAAHDAGIEVDCAPGATALTTALVMSGLSAERFVFDGFLPAKSAARRQRLDDLKHESRTLVFYESPHRLRQSLDDLIAVLGPQRNACIARELTKRYQTLIRGNLAELCDWADDPDEVTRGEFVLVLEGEKVQANPTALDAQKLMQALSAELPPRKAAKITAKLCGGKANDYYQQSLGP